MLTAALATPEESFFYGDHGGWGGVEWDVNVHVTLMMLCWSWGLGWGGWDVNVHVTLMMLRWSWGLGRGGVGWSCYADDVTLIYADHGGWVGWGGVVKFMLRWWCYADHEGWAGVGWNVHVHALQKRCALQDAVLNITENSKASHLKLNEHINTIFLLLSIFSTGDEASWSIIIPSSP